MMAPLSYVVTFGDSSSLLSYKHYVERMRGFSQQVTLATSEADTTARLL